MPVPMAPIDHPHCSLSDRTSNYHSSVSNLQPFRQEAFIEMPLIQNNSEASIRSPIRRTSAAAASSGIPVSPRRSPLRKTSAPASPSKRPPLPSSAKAAFLCVKESVASELTTSEDFEMALQHAGYNPTKKMLRQYWDPERTNPMDFAEFTTICQNEPLPKRTQVLALFK